MDYSKQVNLVEIHDYAKETITDLERTQRRAAERALASIWLEGLEPTDSAKLAFQRYVSAELTIDELIQEIQSLNAREFGPVHISGH